MIISMGANLAGAYLISLTGKRPSETSVQGTYYFSRKFAGTPNIPK
jgi:hypothetical protein